MGSLCRVASLLLLAGCFAAGAEWGYDFEAVSSGMSCIGEGEAQRCTRALKPSALKVIIADAEIDAAGLTAGDFIDLEHMGEEWLEERATIIFPMVIVTAEVPTREVPTRLQGQTRGTIEAAGTDPIAW